MGSRRGPLAPTEDELDMIADIEAMVAKKARLQHQCLPSESATRSLASNLQHAQASAHQQHWQNAQDRWLMPPPQVPIRRLDNNGSTSSRPSVPPGQQVAPVSPSTWGHHPHDVPDTQAYPATSVPNHALEMSLSEVEDLPCSQESHYQYNQLDEARVNDGGTWSQRVAEIASESLDGHAPQHMLPVSSLHAAANVRSSIGQQGAPIAVQQSALPASPTGAWSMPADIHAALQLPFGSEVSVILGKRVGADIMRRMQAELNPEHCKALMLSCLHVPGMWHDTRVHVEQWLDVACRVRAPVPQPSLQLPALILIVFSGCTGSGVPIIALDWALQICRKRIPECNIIVERFISYEISDNANACAKLCYSKVPCPVELKGDVQGMEEDVVAMCSADQARARQRVYLAMAGTECSDTTFANTKHLLSGSRLHGPSGRTWFHWHRAVTRLAREVGPTRVAHMSEFPQCQDECDEQAMDRMAGPYVETKSSSWGAFAIRNRRWRTSPEIGPRERGIGSWLCEKRPDIAGPDKNGWLYSPEPDYHNRHPYPYVLRRFWPHLVENAAKTPFSKLSSMEQMTLKSLRIKKGNEVRRAGVQFFIMHLGLDRTPLQKIVDIWPCDEWHLGAPADVNAPTREELERRCGQQQFCINCFEALRVLGGAWHLHSAAEVCSRVLLCSMLTWVRNTPGTVWHGWGQDGHVCSEQCVHAPVYSTAK